jgi:hypothetical protein
MSQVRQVKVARDEKEIGMYSESDVGVLLLDGTLKSTDRYWNQEAAGWRLLYELVREQELEKSFFLRLGWVASWGAFISLFVLPLYGGYIFGVRYLNEKHVSFSNSISLLFGNGFEGLVWLGKFELLLLCAFGILLFMIWLCGGNRSIDVLYGPDFFRKNHEWVVGPVLKCYFFPLLLFGPGILVLSLTADYVGRFFR